MQGSANWADFYGEFVLAGNGYGWVSCINLTMEMIIFGLGCTDQPNLCSLQRAMVGLAV